MGHNGQRLSSSSAAICQFLWFTMALALRMVFMLIYLSGEWHRANARDIRGPTDICRASGTGDFYWLKRLIADGVDVTDRCESGGYSPIYNAGYRGSPRYVFEMLINAGAYIDQETHYFHETALFGVIARNYWEGEEYDHWYLDAIGFLMEFGASIEKAKAMRLRAKPEFTKRFDAGMKRDSVKAAIDKGLKYQSSNPHVRAIVRHQEALMKLQDRTSVRLIGKDGNINPKAGRLEVYHNGRWGTVCNDGPNGQGDQKDDNMAIIVCRMLGQSGGQTKTTHDFGYGSDPTWMDDVECRGDEESLFDCIFRAWGQENCGHSEDVGIVCD